MRVIVYRKTGCPWAQEVMEYLDQHDIPFEERTVNTNELYAQECLQKSGRLKSPTLDIDGTILADVGVEEVADYFEGRGRKAA